MSLFPRLSSTLPVAILRQWGPALDGQRDEEAQQERDLELHNRFGKLLCFGKSHGASGARSMTTLGGRSPFFAWA